jgi:hypothetical protein
MPGREPLDLDSLDEEDPFEVDDINRPHLYKHEHYGYDDMLDVFASDPLFFPAQPGLEADWLMVGEPPGEPPLVVPLAPPKSRDPRKARPIGIYRASGELLEQYNLSRGPHGKR